MKFQFWEASTKPLTTSARYCLAVGLFCLVPLYAKAVPLHATEASVFRVDFSIGTSFNSGYDFLLYSIAFEPSSTNDPLEFGEGWTVTVFNAADLRVGSAIFRMPFSGGGIGLSAGVAFHEPPELFNSTGHLIFSDIVGNFDFEGITVELGFNTQFGFGIFGPVNGVVSVVSEPSSLLLAIAALLAMLTGWRYIERLPVS